MFYMRFQFYARLCALPSRFFPIADTINLMMRKYHRSLATSASGIWFVSFGEVGLLALFGHPYLVMVQTFSRCFISHHVGRAYLGLVARQSQHHQRI